MFRLIALVGTGLILVLVAGRACAPWVIARTKPLDAHVLFWGLEMEEGGIRLGLPSDDPDVVRISVTGPARLRAQVDGSTRYELRMVRGAEWVVEETKMASGRGIHLVVRRPYTDGRR